MLPRECSYPVRASGPHDDVIAIPASFGPIVAAALLNMVKSGVISDPVLAAGILDEEDSIKSDFQDYFR